MSEIERDESPARATSGLRVPWPLLSISLAVIAIGSLGTLVVIATIHKADTLSTVALALAILAFAAEIVVALAQSQASSQQLSDTGRVNSETRGLLTQIRAQSEALLTNQREQFAQVLTAALGREVIRTAVDQATGQDDVALEEDSTPDQSAVDRAQLTDRLQSSIASAIGIFGGQQSISRSADENAYMPFVQEMQTYPSEADGKRAYEVLRTLNPFEWASFARRVESDLSRARRGLAPRGRVAKDDNLSSSSKSLERKGLIRYDAAQVNGQDVKFRTLTPLGRAAGSFISATGPMPKWYRDLRENK